jgi:hypothetical protein
MLISSKTTGLWVWLSSEESDWGTRASDADPKTHFSFFFDRIINRGIGAAKPFTI